jgi:cobalt-zinc-cadmium efflux system membrane fusion protein
MSLFLRAGVPLRTWGSFALSALILASLALSVRAAELPKPLPAKSGDKVSLRQDQLHQIEVAPIGSRPFVDIKPGIGQISFNEDMSSVVLAPFSGRVTRLFAKVGDVVRRGDPLFELDSPEVVQAQTDLIAAVQGLGKANSTMALAKRTLDRQVNLLAGQATSQRDVDLAKNDHAAAEADIRMAEGALRAARNRLRVMIGRTAEEIARIEQDRVIDPTITVNAPIDGTIVARKIGPGQYVRSDLNDPLFSISDLSTMWLKAAVPENDIPSIKLGQEIEVKVAALSDRAFKARVSAIGAASDQATRRVVVRAELPNPDGLLRSEMFATFRIKTGTPDKVIGVPTNAVVWDGEDSIVWVQMEPMLFQRRKVKIGREQGGFVQIRDGLKVGELIATRGAIFIDNEWRQ